MLKCTIRRAILLVIAAMLGLLAWQVPLVLELQSRARWIADAQRAAAMLESRDLRQWPSLDPEVANTTFSVFFSGVGIRSPEAKTERERRSLLFGAFITRGPALPPGLDVGVGARNAPQMVDPTEFMLRTAMEGLGRMLTVLVILFVIVPMLARAAWVVYERRAHRLGVEPSLPRPSWLLVVVVPTLALVLSWGWFDRINLWGASVPGWQEASVIGITAFAMLVLPGLIKMLLIARDSAASADGRCPGCFYGPFADPKVPNTPRCCPECGIDTSKPPPRRLSHQRILLWVPRLAPVVFLIIACWWPIRVIGPYLFAHGFSRPVIPGHPLTAVDAALTRWTRMQWISTSHDFTSGRIILVRLGTLVGAGQDLSQPSTPATAPTPPPPEPAPQTPPPPP